eukprot:scaffold81290_cov59-Phaeocystis_antarctica.AAC.2
MRVVDIQPVHDDCLRGVATVLVGLVEGVAGAEEAKVDYGVEAVEKQLHQCARRGFGDVWRVRTRGRGNTPPVTLREIGRGNCEELVRRQKHSGNVVAEAHLTTL